VDEKKLGYGPIKVFNATVEIKTIPLPYVCPAGHPECVRKKENQYYYWHGDISEKRFGFLLEMTKRFSEIEEITINFENSASGPFYTKYIIKNGDSHLEKTYVCNKCHKSILMTMDQISCFCPNCERYIAEEWVLINDAADLRKYFNQEMFPINDDDKMCHEIRRVHNRIDKTTEIQIRLREMS